MRLRHATALLAALAACGGTDLGAFRQAFLDAGVNDGAPADAGVDAGVIGTSDAGQPPAAPTLAGCPMFPVTNEWNRDVSGDPVDPHSADYLTFMGAGSLTLWPGFAGGYGMPFAVVPPTQARVPMSFLYVSQSDPGPYPFPLDVPIEDNVDHHAAVLVQGDCKLYETYQTSRSGAGFYAEGGALFDLVTGAPRPDGWTSATAAGLPILPGLARYDEAVEKGEILHALAFIAGNTAYSYVAPATHSAGTSTATYAPPMGLRVRLRADFDLSKFSGASLVILRALKKYGMFITDNASGDKWYVAGSLDSRWSVPDIDQLKTIPASAFEVVKLGTVHPGG